MRPLQDAIEGCEQLLISPDGALNLIPFGALVDETGTVLADRYRFIYLTSARELLRTPAADGSRQGVVVVVCPDYFANGLDLTRTIWPSLPNKMEEAKAIRGHFPDATQWKGEDASEDALEGLQGPSLLHIATHGAVRPELAPHTPLDNPLLAPVLVLAGANGPVSADRDGLMTALELSALDLHGTQLVVLSACESGTGEMVAGAGVYALRRALVVAGAETQVTSLWSVRPTRRPRCSRPTTGIWLKAPDAPSLCTRRSSRSDPIRAGDIPITGPHSSPVATFAPCELRLCVIPRSDNSSETRRIYPCQPRCPPRSLKASGV